MAQVQHFLGLRPSSSTNGMFIPVIRPQFNPKLHIHIFAAISLSKFPRRLTLSFPNHVSTTRPSPFAYPHHPTSGFRRFCNFNDSDSMSQLELGKRKPEKRVNAIFWIILLNLAIYVADHMFLVRDIKSLYLFHNQPAWYQFVTAAFCHANWNHLSSNLFFLYIFGKLVEEEEGSFALWVSYILTGAGANLVSWLVLPRNAVSVGASGAVFGLFAISVLVKLSMDWRKILEVLILGQFVVEKVMEAAHASTGLSNGFIGTHSLQNVNHIAHLSGALVGVLLVWLLSKVPSDPSEKEG
ncbi:hypothetical protein SOVF_040520 [Spinacia oleracea]|uniref:Rhomboid-like protein 11, chloroplastic n=1 Tax=Spinacia oleracea TaxID=3562 RepID=A0A9R0HR43_SPIOL|nr:rhomboid-like protein 11, chloroplastic [Spinacia oleracea]KNA21755.1 hypothetical protein SOVF_040520 [Spinacia oleracea]